MKTNAEESARYDDVCKADHRREEGKKADAGAGGGDIEEFLGGVLAPPLGELAKPTGFD